MKRNIDTCRSLLIRIESKPDGIWYGPGETAEESYHLWLLKDGGYLSDYLLDNLFSPIRKQDDIAHSFRLTSKGHDFLELARDDGRWNGAKAHVLSRTGGTSFDLIVSLLSMEAMKSLRYDA